MRSLKALLVVAFLAGVFADEQLGDTCETMQPFCTDTGTGFRATRGVGTTAAYGCLGTTPNPSWYYMRIAVGGDMQIELRSQVGGDIDFALWGPFNSLDDAILRCDDFKNIGEGQNQQIVLPPIDCSWTTDVIEYADLTNAQVGEYYVLLFTNFADDAIPASDNHLVSINKVANSGFAETDCGVLQCSNTVVNSNGLTTGMVQNCGTGNFGDNCVVQCTSGYVVSGNMVTSCGFNGWSAITGFCVVQAVSCSPMAINNGFVTCSGTAGSTCTGSSVQCNSGFTFSGTGGSFGYQCGSNGLWAAYGGAACIAQVSYCYGQTLGNVNLNSCGAVAEGGSCTGTCNSGYVAQGSLVYFCGANGQWYGGAQCILEVTYCYPSTVSQGGATLELNCVGVDGEYCTGECPSGYEPAVSNMEFLCMGGIWSGSGYCTLSLNTCFPTSRPNSNLQINCGQQTEGQICTGVCNAGYEAVTNLDFYCGSAGYTGDGFCSRIVNYCYAFSPAGLNYRVDCGTQEEGQSCTGVCNAGYEGSNLFCYCGSNGYQCSGSCTLIVNYCYSTSPAGLNFRLDCGTQQEGQSCTGVCNAGYESVGNLACYCGPNGYVCSGQCTAIVNYCFRTEPVGTNAFIDCGTQTEGQYCTAQCFSGYENSALSNMEYYCGANGYSGTGYCTLIVNYCYATSPVGLNFRLDCGTQVEGATCTGVCNAGYENSANTNLVCTCGPGGYVCSGYCTLIPNYCYAISPVGLNYRADCGTQVEGDSCTGVCNSGYENLGSNLVCYCGPNGYQCSGFCTAIVYNYCYATSPQGLNFRLDCGTQLEGASCQGICNAGYENSANTNLMCVCGPNGYVCSGYCSVQINYCSSALIGYNTFDTCGTIQEDTCCTAYCATGYHWVSGSMQRCCGATGWLPFTGRCTANIDGCLSNPCGFGTCTSDQTGVYSCFCDVGYFFNGVTCQNDNDCLNNPCGVNAGCIDGLNTYTCYCLAGLIGDPYTFCFAPSTTPSVTPSSSSSMTPTPSPSMTPSSSQEEEEEECCNSCGCESDCGCATDCGCGCKQSALSEINVNFAYIFRGLNFHHDHDHY